MLQCVGLVEVNHIDVQTVLSSADDKGSEGGEDTTVVGETQQDVLAEDSLIAPDVQRSNPMEFEDTSAIVGVDLKLYLLCTLPIVFCI
jgi:hypothetical protein